MTFTLLAIYACGGDDDVVNAPDELTDASRPDSKLTAPETSSTSDQYVPPAADGRASLALGEGFGCIISATSEVYCWGRNDFGQLGSDPAKTPSSPTPLKVEGLKNVVALTAGKDFACALDDEHHGWCWGNNSRNQVIGRHGETMRFTPELVTDGTAQIVAAGQHACILDTNGFLHCWGDNDCNLFGATDGGTLGVVQVPTQPMKHVSLGPDAMCAVTEENGEVYCWGADHKGSLGHPLPASPGTCAGGLPFDATPKRWVTDDIGHLLSGAEDVHVGSAITCARKTDGTVLCAGDNSHGGLGQGVADSDSHRVPVEVPAIKAAKVVVGGETGCGVVTDKLLCWGDARYGQMPTGEANTTCDGTGCRPLGLVIDGQEGIRDLSVSTGGIGTIKNDVSVWVWGRNDSGQTGVASTDAVNTTCAGGTKCIASPHAMPNLPALK